MDNCILVKLCTKCYVEKNVNEFYKTKTGKYGVGSKCKQCTLKYCKERRAISTKRNRERYRNNENTRLLKRLSDKRYFDKNKEKINEYQKLYRLKNSVELSLYNKEWYNKNRALCIKKSVANLKRLRSENPRVRFSDNLRSLIRSSFYRRGLKKPGKIFNLLGFTPKDLYDYLSKWLNKPCEHCGVILIENPRNFVIEHITPLCSANSEQEIINLNKLKNLRLLCSGCNLKKISSDVKQHI